MTWHITMDSFFFYAGGPDNQVHFEGYQVSNQCMALVRDECLLPCKDAPELGFAKESSPEQYVPDVFYKVGLHLVSAFVNMICSYLCLCCSTQKDKGQSLPYDIFFCSPFKRTKTNLEMTSRFLPDLCLWSTLSLM